MKDHFRKVTEIYHHQAVKLIIKLVFYVYLMAISIYWMARFLQQPLAYTDLRSLYPAAQILQTQPQNLYEIGTQYDYEQRLVPEEVRPAEDQLVMMPYPPMILLLFAPFTSWSFSTAFLITGLLNTVILLLDIYLLNRLLKPRVNKMLLLLMVLSFAPIYAVLTASQTTFLVLLIFLLIYGLLTRQKWFLSGLATSLLLIKPQFALFIGLYLVALRKKEIIAGLLLGGGFFMLAGRLLTPAFPREMLRLWSNYVGDQAVNWTTRISWAGFFTQVKNLWPGFHDTLWTIPASWLTMLISLWALLSVKIKRRSLPQIMNVILVTTLLTGVHIHSYESGLMLFPACYFLSRKRLDYVHYLLLFLGWIIFNLAVVSVNHQPPVYFLPTLFLVFVLGLLIKCLNPKQKVVPGHS